MGFKLSGINLHRVSLVFYTIASPVVYIVAKMLRSRRLVDTAIRMDGMNLRALSDKYGSKHPVVGKLIIAIHMAAAVSPEDGKRMIDMLPHAQGQLLQDMFALLASRGRREGTFVEVGVGNGRDISNTYLLEKELAWNGILVEPNQSSHGSIREFRKAKLETRAAASKSGLKLEFEEVTDDGELSRLSGAQGRTVDESMIKRYEVETVTLNEIFREAGMPSHIDFMSLDTEGSELDILAGLDLDHYVFSALAIEHNFNQEKLNSLRQLLLPRGYRQVFENITSFDAWFVHSSAPDQFLAE